MAELHTEEEMGVLPGTVADTGRSPFYMEFQFES